MNIFTLAQTKGGVGKSTLCMNIACEASMQGIDVLIIEMDRQGDAQGTVSNWADRRESEVPLVCQSNGINLPKILSQAEQDGIALALIDLPGAHNPSAIWAIRESDFIIMPTRTSLLDIEASIPTIKTLADEEKLGAYILTFTAPSAKVTRETRSNLENAGMMVAPGAIRDNKIFPQAATEGKSVAEINPKSPAAKDIADFWCWLKMKGIWTK